MFDECHLPSLLSSLAEQLSYLDFRLVELIPDSFWVRIPPRIHTCNNEFAYGVNKQVCIINF